MQLVSFDYEKRITECGPVIEPSNNIEADMKKIQEYYEGSRLNTPINLVVSICKCSPLIFWLLKEYIDGQLVHSRIPRELKQVVKHLKLLERNKHLFEPRRNDELIAEIHAKVDRYWKTPGQ